jgi:8-oxo-dGTP diphosphatase
MDRSDAKMNILLVVCAALVNADNEVLLAQRPEGKRLAGKWEFPGGKVEEGESAEAALIRELKEELGITVAQADLESFWFLSHAYPEFGFHLLMPVYVCRTWQGEPQALEHAGLIWASPAAMDGLDMIEADAALVGRLRKYLIS